jgi:hypothetical protein
VEAVLAVTQLEAARVGISNARLVQ